MDIIRRAVLLGLGVISLTKEKAEDMVDDLIKRGEVASGERFKVVDTCSKRSKSRRMSSNEK